MISPGYEKISVPPSPGGDDHCTVQTMSVLLPGRDFVRGVGQWKIRGSGATGRRCDGVWVIFFAAMWALRPTGGMDVRSRNVGITAHGYSMGIHASK